MCERRRCRRPQREGGCCWSEKAFLCVCERGCGVPERLVRQRLCGNGGEGPGGECDELHHQHRRAASPSLAASVVDKDLDLV